MARKRNNTAGGAKKPAKPKRASRSASVSATPASVSPVSVSPAPGSSTVGESHPTVAEQSVGAETIAEEQVVVEESVAEQTTVEESVVEEQKVEESIAEETVKETIEESIVEETVLEKKIVEQTIPEESIIEQSTSEESSIKKSAINASSATESATEKPAASESSSEQSPAAYSLDISPEHDFCRETTEDQLDLIIESQHPPAPTHAPLSDDLSPARPLFSSVNMEDSQAELLASNLADSTYHSSLASSADEFHVLEAPSAEIHPAEEEELLEDEQHGFDQHDARSYVVTPGAYASTGPQDTEEIDVQDAVAAVDTVVDAVAAAGARADDAVPQLNIQENAVTEQENRTDAEPKTHTDAEPQTNTNTAAEPECTANPDQDLRQEHDIDGDHAQNTPPNDSVVLLSESYVHVEHESSRDVIGEFTSRAYAQCYLFRIDKISCSMTV
ncbi:hypothetical protein IW150_002887 [Coemansia sp. RSA 2607]|nr:hypothetical protein IW150_002887 [Coemansia sp. RSA 2607]